MINLRRPLIGVGVLALVSGVGAFLAVINGEHNIHRGAYAALTLGIGWGFTGTGLYVWTRRPGSNVGPLMTAVGFCGFLKALSFSNDSVVFTIGSLGEVLIYAVLVHLLLSFPSGRLETRLDRGLVAIAYFNTTVVQLAAFVLTDSRAGCARCPANPLLIDHAAAARAISTAQVDIAVAVLGAVVAVLYRRWRGGTPAQGRAFAPVVAVGSLTLVLLMAALIVEQADLSSKVADALTLALFGSFACLPFAFLAGLLRSRFDEAEAITLENERLDAELRATVAELRASRARIVQAGDEQRRRIERDLHDGAQQRLMALGINLRLLRGRIVRDPQDAVELLDASLQELGEATAELRELARGIHPAVLTDRGLSDALNALARRSPVPVQVVEMPGDRLPPSIESAAYFVVAEALTNAARYATARSVTVSVVRGNGQVEIAVTDDGVGGADPERGSGLRGLHDRVAALDGHLDLASGASKGTTLRARIPCG